MKRISKNKILNNKNLILKKKSRLQVFDLKIKTKKKFYINILKSFFMQLKKNKNTYNFIVKKKIQKIVVNKSPHVNSKAKKKYLDVEYSIFARNLQTKYFSIFKRLVTTDTYYVFNKKII
jgi:hypothetical protein